MGWVIMLMNIVAPIAELGTLTLVFPLYLVVDLVKGIKNRFTAENVAGKVVLITGASSGIGESLAYEYAKRGARLALAARKEDHLQLEGVAVKAKKLGSPDLLAICVDVSKPQDCSDMVDQTVLHFGQLDHLVNNAGIADASMFEDCSDISKYVPLMDVNFWGSVHCTHSALPHLRKAKGKIVANSTIGCWMPAPKLSIYNASKAAMTTFFEILRVELGSEVGITIATPGIIQTNISTDEFFGEIGFNRRFAESSEACAKAIIESTCRGDRYLTVPSCYKLTFLVKLLAPELLEWILYYLATRKTNGSKKHV